MAPMAKTRCREERGDQQPSAKHRNLAKQRLSFCRVTQDGDWEGCLHLDRLPSAHEAATIRDLLRWPIATPVPHGRQTVLKGDFSTPYRALAAPERLKSRRLGASVQ